MKRSSSSRPEKKSKKRKKSSGHKKKRRKSSSDDSSLTSDSDSSSTGSSCDTDSSRERKKIKLKEKKKKEKKLKKEVSRKSKKAKKRSRPEECPAIGPAVPDEILAQAKRMAPMTKEEWEKKQSVIKRVYDPETGRQRLIKGDGEVLEEIVSRDRHKEINRQATVGDGEFFQYQLNRK